MQMQVQGQESRRGATALAVARDGRGLSTVLLGLVALLTVVATIAAGTLRASAHEHREVGEYMFVVGFNEEPALQGQPNALILEVHEGPGDDGAPVEGLEDTLEATIIHGEERMQLDLRPMWNTPGSYLGDVIPVATGTYSFQITGTINGTEVDETFTGGPETFSEVGSAEAISFPAADDGDAEADSAVQDAQDAADSARMLAIVGILIGVVGVGAGLAGAMAARRRA